MRWPGPQAPQHIVTNYGDKARGELLEAPGLDMEQRGPHIRPNLVRFLGYPINQPKAGRRRRRSGHPALPRVNCRRKVGRVHLDRVQELLRAGIARVK